MVWVRVRIAVRGKWGDSVGRAHSKEFQMWPGPQHIVDVSSWLIVHQDGTTWLGVEFGSPFTRGAGCKEPGASLALSSRHILNDSVSGKAVTSPPPPPQGGFLEKVILELEGPVSLFPTRRHPCLSGSQNLVSWWILLDV